VPLRIATRASTLARWQAECVGALLGEPVEYVLVSTTGDRDQRSDLHAIGGTGVFTKEVQEAVLDGRADLAVHSAKDLPSTTPPGLVLAAVPERGDPRDALVGARLDDIPAGGRIATSSVRRRAQLAAVRPDLVFAPLRGNIETRLRKQVDEGHDAVVVAMAALDRLGLAGAAAEVLDASVLLPQAAQGALGVECRADDVRTSAALAAIDDPPAHAAVDAERAYLAELGGGCTLPCGALARIVGDELVLDALLAAADGHIVLRTRVVGDDPVAVGAAAARDLLDAKGGRAVLDLDVEAMP
jgi:hydroxymethylbilane synthase